jgi:hypothetical protein
LIGFEFHEGMRLGTEEGLEARWRGLHRAGAVETYLVPLALRSLYIW